MKIIDKYFNITMIIIFVLLCSMFAAAFSRLHTLDNIKEEIYLDCLKSNSFTEDECKESLNNYWKAKGWTGRILK